MAQIKFQANSTNTSKFDLTFTSGINCIKSVAISANTLVFRMKTGAMIKQDLHNTLFEKLENFRKQGKNISELNPILALADDICEQIYQKKITHEDIELLITKMGSQLWDTQIRELRVKTGTETNVETLLSATDLASVDVSKTIYQAVFTAHPVFSLNAKNSCKLSEMAGRSLSKPFPDNAYDPRTEISLQDEHDEATSAIKSAREAIMSLHKKILKEKFSKNMQDWRDTAPKLFAVSTWVGYDLDGRSDISWLDSFRLRLSEKKTSLDLYVEKLAPFLESHSEVGRIINELSADRRATEADLARFSKTEDNRFADAANLLTERQDKLIASKVFAERLRKIAADTQNPEEAIELLAIAGDIASNGFGLGELHLRINAVQLANAMGVVDGKGNFVSLTDGRSRTLVERLAERISLEPGSSINFQNLEHENATARRQFMLATQILKHIDSDQPIRLLIAECEHPVTVMSALYLARKFGIEDRLDISPLFETTFGLEHGVQLVEQLLGYEVFRQYIIKRGRLAIQTGFSDAGRFIGQITANLAIERLQLKVAKLVSDVFDGEVEFLLFNTHGESLGRGCGRPTIEDRQNFILTPHVRSQCQMMNLKIHHQSSFQGGDGYRMFGNQKLATSTIYSLFLVENFPPGKEIEPDEFYSNTDFSLDMFLALKAWHENLFSNPNYGLTLDIFGANLLPTTGSRPVKRVVQNGVGRSDPSKMRAIPHNAILQQLGFLGNVISGFGSAANIDTDLFARLYEISPRLRQLCQHVLAAKQIGSLNTLLAYAKLLDNGFWIDRAYHGYQPSNMDAYRQIGLRLVNDPRANAVRNIVWIFRDDLINLYELSKSVGVNDVRVSGEERIGLDVLHALRIALIIDSLALICRVPTFSDSNRHTNEDVLGAALALDFEEVENIIRQEFSLNKVQTKFDSLAETQDYDDGGSTDYNVIEEQILVPFRKNRKIIMLISQMVSGHYGAHG